MRPQASPSTFTVDARDPVGRASGEARSPPAAARRRAPAERVEHLRELVARRRAAAAACSGVGRRRGAASSTARAIAEPRACAAGQPGTSASAGSSSHTHHEHAERRRPTAPPTRSTLPAPARGQRDACSAAADDAARAPGRGTRRRGARRRPTSSELGRPVAARTPSSDVGQEPGGDDEARPPARPTTTTRATKPEAVAAEPGGDHGATRMTRSSSVHRRRRLRPPSRRACGEEAGVGDHAVVGPDRLALDVPARAAAPRASRPCRTALSSSASRSWADLDDRRRVGDEDPARAQRRLGVLHDLPRLGEVEHDAVEVASRRCPRSTSRTSTR